MIHELYDSLTPLPYFIPIESTFSGNLRVELASSVNCDVQLERSYLVRIPRLYLSAYYGLITVQIDFSKELVNWVKTEGYSLLDVNLFPKPSDQPFPVCSYDRQTKIQF
jgi:hypothetical protein